MSVGKKYHYWISSGQYTGIQKLVTLLAGIISFMMLARILGPSGFGVWGLFLTISAIIETARTALVKNAFIRFSGQLEERESDAGLQGGAFLLSLVISLCWAVVLVSAAAVISHLLNAPELKSMLLWYAGTILISVFFTHFEILMNAKMNFKALCWMFCVRQGTLLLLIFVFFTTGTTITTRALSIIYLVSVIAGSVAGFAFARSVIQFHWAEGKRRLPELLGYGKYVFGNNMSSLLFRSTDSFLTSNVFGPAIAAFYNASLRISNLVDMPSQVLGDVLFPKAAKISKGDHAAVRNSYEKTVGATLIFSIPALLVLLLFPGPILTIIAGPEFIEATPILRITAFFGFTLPFIKQFGTIMDATGLPDVNFKVMFFAFCLNVITNLAGIYYFGFLGAALGTALTYFILLIVTQQILYSRYGIRWTAVFRNTWNLYRELAGSAKLLWK